MPVHSLPRKKHIRNDGWLAELVSFQYPDHPFTGIHSYVVSINPGHSRANHYHEKKEEWIALAAGTVTLIMEDIRSGERETVILESVSEDYRLIYIPPFVAHSVQNNGKGEAAVIVFSRTPEDPNDTLRFRFD